MYRIEFVEGSWVDIAHSETLAAISHWMRDELYDLGLNLGLTLSEVTSNYRPLTSAIATWLRDTATLDDDSQPTGVRFPSKHGTQNDGEGTCWAFWMRQADAGLDTTRVASDDGEEFGPDDPDFLYALDLHNLQAR